MPHNTTFELPAQRFGNVVSHDMVYTPEQRELQAVVDSIGTRALGQTVVPVEKPAEAAPVEAVETYGQYL